MWRTTRHRGLGAYVPGNIPKNALRRQNQWPCTKQGSGRQDLDVQLRHLTSGKRLGALAWMERTMRLAARRIDEAMRDA
jgi:hypothetical protein